MFRRVLRAAIISALTCPIALAQESAAINVPDTARAGETVTFRITLDKAPDFDGASVMYWVGCSSGFSIQSSAEVTRGSNAAAFSFKLPADVGSELAGLISSSFTRGRGPTIFISL
jgi:hypothetical protein